MAFLDYAGLSRFLDKLKTIFIQTSSKGVANGVAELDANGIVPVAQLPDIVDDVIEYDAKDFTDWTEWVSGTSYVIGDKVKITGATTDGYICKTANSSATFNPAEWNEATSFPASGVAGKIYVSTSTNTLYRWDGTEYVCVGAAGDNFLREISFYFATTDWTHSGSTYTASVTNSNFGSNSVEFVTYDISINTGLAGYLSTTKNSSVHTMTFTTNEAPTGVISGKIYSFINSTEGVPVTYVTEALPVENGGTGATTAAAARNNLGITDALAEKLDTNKALYIQTGATATTPIPKGSYFVYNNNLSIALTAIAVGDTFVSGTNYDLYSPALGGAINIVNRRIDDILSACGLVYYNGGLYVDPDQT